MVYSTPLSSLEAHLPDDEDKYKVWILAPVGSIVGENIEPMVVLPYRQTSSDGCKTCSVEDNPPGLLDPSVLQQGLEGSSLGIEDVRAPTNLNWLHGESRHNEDSSGFSFHDRVLSLLNCSRNEDGCSSPLVGLDVG